MIEQRKNNNVCSSGELQRNPISVREQTRQSTFSFAIFSTLNFKKVTTIDLIRLRFNSIVQNQKLKFVPIIFSGKVYF